MSTRSTWAIEGGAPLNGFVELPADKSILHRALLMAALTDGVCQIVAGQPGQDNLATAAALRALGLRVEQDDDRFEVHGRGLQGLAPPPHPIDCGNSGTTIRLLSGLLAGAGVPATLMGDASLQRRPMARICEPLRQLGAAIQGDLKGKRELPPLVISRGAFAGGFWESAVASAQVKSALLLAGIAAGRTVKVHEPRLSRDHTERMLQAMNVQIASTNDDHGATAEVPAGVELASFSWSVPGDFSAAAFWLAAAALIPGTRLRMLNVGLNPTRTGLYDLMPAFGVRVAAARPFTLHGESLASLEVEAGGAAIGEGSEKTVRVDGALIPRLIDELPLVAAMAAARTGTTEIRDAAELRVKESDRIAESVRLLAAFGVEATPLDDGLRVVGPQTLRAAHFDVGDDHRVAMTAAVLAMAAPGESRLEGLEVAAVSYPGFIEQAERLGARLRRL